MNRNKTAGVIAGSGLLLLALTISTIALNNSLKSVTKSKAGDYTLTLNSSNGISGSSVTTTQNVSTDSGAYQVAFSYESCSELSGGHATIEAGGLIYNSDHIRSIYALSAQFESNGALKFRASYDGATWGGYTTMISAQEYELSSKPYYIEFSTDGINSVDITSVQFAYTCEVNESANEDASQTEPVYEKIYSSDELEDGQYLIVYESTSLAFDGSLKSFAVSNNSTSVTITNDTIPSNETTDASSFTIASSGSAYTIKSASGYYIGKASGSSGTLTGSTSTSYSENISLSSGSASIYQSGNKTWYLRYYTSSSSIAPFTYVNNSSYGTNLSLFKLVEGSVSYDTPVDENGFSASDANINTYSTNSVYDTDNAITAYATYTDGSTVALTADDYSYEITDSYGDAVDTSSAFPSAGTYTLSISYKNFAAIETEFTVSEYVAVTGVSLSSSSEELESGSSVTLTATVLPSNASNQNIIWSSSDTSVAKVEDGVVNGFSEGTATITATTSEGGFTASCTVSVSGDKWTILLYLCGADLESTYTSGSYSKYTGLATGNIKEILSVDLPDGVNFVIQTGGCSSWESDYGISSSYLQRWHVENGSLVNDASLTNASMGESSTLQSFIEYGLENYPAGRTGFIYWNHGGAMGGCCYDENYSDDCLTNAEMHEAFANAFANQGRTDNLEWVGWDCCLMAVQDVADFHSEFFNYMVCSQESEPGEGWDYDTWLGALAANTDISTVDLLSTIADSFVQKCEDTYAGYTGYTKYDAEATLSVLDLSKADAYATAWEDMASDLSSVITSSSVWSSFKSILTSCERFGATTSNNKTYYYYDIFDVQDFIDNMKSSSTFSSVSMTALQSALNDFVVYDTYGCHYTQSSVNLDPCGLCLFCPISGYAGYTGISTYNSDNTNYSTWLTLCQTYGSWYSK